MFIRRNVTLRGSQAEPHAHGRILGTATAAHARSAAATRGTVTHRRLECCCSSATAATSFHQFFSRTNTRRLGIFAATFAAAVAAAAGHGQFENAGTRGKTTSHFSLFDGRKSIVVILVGTGIEQFDASSIGSVFSVKVIPGVGRGGGTSKHGHDFFCF